MPLVNDVEPGMVIVDYVLSKADGGPGAEEHLHHLKPYGAVALATRAPGVRAIAVRKEYEAQAQRWLADTFYEEPDLPDYDSEEEEPDRCTACGALYDECACLEGSL